MIFKEMVKLDIQHKLILLILTIMVLAGGRLDGFSQVTQIDNIHGKSQSFAEHKRSASKDSTQAATKGAFIPVPFIITDQNLGFGALLSLTYIHANSKKTTKDSPPAITAIAGGGTTTKSWMIAALHSHSFNYDKLRYLGALVYINMNLDFYSIGNIDLSDKPVGVNLNGYGTLQRILFRIKKSNFFIGPQYSFMRINSSLNIKDNDHPIFDSLLRKINVHQNLSALGLLAQYDTRKNTLSPNKGIHTGFGLNYNATWLGASQNFYKLELYFYGYVPLTKWLFSIYHFDAQFIDGDAPFYMKPYVELRGAPMMRYQGNQTMLAEVQFRGYFYKSLALVAFTGVGKAFDSFSEFKSARLIVDYGTGIRWELKKMFGVRLGLDFAWTNNNDFGWYVVIGTGL
jgi:hypothetical protein